MARRGEVFDATIEVPVTIRNPDKPIGTHVFTAVARNGAGLRWTAVTIDKGDDAKDALDRISIPQDVLDRIAPTALPRSSITISDEPLNRETNDRTEFVVVLNNQPQGGLAMRRHVEVSVARRERGGPSYDPRQNGQSYYPWQNGQSYYPWQNGQYYYPRQNGQYYSQRQQGWW